MASYKGIIIGLAVATFILLLSMPSILADSSFSADSEIRINYVVDGECGTNSPLNPQVYSGGSVPLADAVANDGYRFAGWYVITSSFFSSSYSKITDFNQYRYNGPVDVYAFWYYAVDVSYEMNGGTLNDAKSEILTDEINSIGIPEYGGHTFFQWNYRLQPKDTSCTLNNNLMTQKANSGTLTYIANWYYSVRYDAVEDAVNPNQGYYPPGYSMTLKDATREGYEFLGWFDESNNKVTVLKNRDYLLTAKWLERQSYSITYDLDGGTLIGEQVDRYYEGESKALPQATKSGYYFNGWMTNGEKSGRIENISAQQSGDLVLVPWWIDVEDMKGHGYVLDYSMTAKQGIYSQDYSDTITTRYYEFDQERGFFALRSNSGGDVSTYWTNEGESEYEFEYLGMQNYALNGTDYLCEVYLADYPTYYEKQYIYDGWVPIKIEFSYTSGWVTYRGVYTLAERITFDIDGVCDVRGYGDAGIIVNGSGSYTIGTDVVLEADIGTGTVFRGWYNESGVLLSSDSVYRFTVYNDLRIYAYNDDDVDYTAAYGKGFELPHPEGMTHLRWNVYNPSTGETKEYEGEAVIELRSGGNNIVTYSGTLGDRTVYCFYVVSSDGYAVKSFEWKYNGKNYSMDLDILYSDFAKYRNDSVSRRYVDMNTTLGFITSDDRYVVQIAKYMMTQTYGMNDTERMNVLLAFVDYIEYRYDSDSMGKEEYFKYPLETLYDRNGDCEDTSILFCAIASAMGYRSAMILFNDHMAASVEITDGSVNVRNPATFVRDNVTYYYCETTSTGWVVGNSPKDYTYGGSHYAKESDVTVIPVASNYRLSDIDFSGSEAVIDRTGLSEADEKGNGLMLKSDDISVDFSSDAVSYLTSLNADLKFSYSVADASLLSEEQKAVIGDNPAFSFSLVYGDNAVSDLNGMVTIHLRYEIPADSNIHGVKISYVGEDGTLETLDTAYLDDGYVHFETGHFSIYMLEFTYGSDNAFLFMGIGAVVAILILAGVVLLRRR